VPVLRIPAFWKALIIVVLAYALFDHAFPPVMPISLLVIYMSITLIGVLLYFSFDDARWAEFLQPVQNLVYRDGLWPARWALLLGIPALAGLWTYTLVRPQQTAPVELRQVHPAPPSTLHVYGKRYDLTSLENPLRTQVLEELTKSPEAAWKDYRTIVGKGRDVYYKNCFYCHGDLQQGHGIFAKGLNPPPANFRDVGTIAQLQEAYLFWRITTGGPGLPKEGAPWNSAMPVWSEMLDEEEVWQVITFLYDRVGQVPRMWNQKVSKAVTGMKEQVSRQRKASFRDAHALYEFYCSACHGKNGAGDGPAAQFLYPAPRDFRWGFFKDKTSPSEMLPTDADLLHTIKHGLVGTAMPAWEELLSDAQIKSLISVIKGFDQVGSWAPEDAPDSAFDDEGHYLGEPISFSEKQALGDRVPFGPESVAAGRKLFLDTCAQCHGEDGRGNPNPGKRLKDEWGSRIWPRDLTKPWTWRITEATGTDVASRNRTIGNIFTRLSIGIPGTPMPAHADRISAADRWRIADYVFTLRDYTAPPAETPVIRGLPVNTRVPDQVTDPAWDEAPATTLMMLPNIIKEGRLFKSLTDAVTVRVLYNDKEIGLLLEMDDRTHSVPGDPDAERAQDKKLKLYPDAFAMEWPKANAYTVNPVVEKPLSRHGDTRHGVTIWYWNAGAVEPKKEPATVVMDADGVDKKPQFRRDDHSVRTDAKWVAGRWRVLMKRSRQASVDGDISFSEGRFLPVAFANWDGSNGEVGSKHSLSSWYWLLLPEKTNTARNIGFSAVVAATTFLLGWWLLALVRGKKNH